MKMYELGDTVYITCEHETYDLATDTWTTADPDANYPKITIADPDGTTKVDATSMSKAATGKFEQVYTLPSDGVTGKWRGWIEVRNSTYPDFEYFAFLVS